MECGEARMLMSADVDGELAIPDRVKIDQHLAACTACTQAQGALHAVHRQLQAHIERHAAPPHVRHRLGATLRGADAPGQPWRWRWPTLTRERIAFAMAGVSSTAFAVLLAAYLAVPSPTQRLDDEVVSSHFRSLMSGHPIDVASSDQHTVKPWFAGKIDFSPPVHDLAPDGYPLIGARVDYLERRQVAALVYQRHRHVVTVYVWPDPTQQTRAPQVRSEQGYQLARWSGEGMQYEAVSDLNRQELLDLAARLMAWRE